MALTVCWGVVSALLAVSVPIAALDNGLALTPPMGWLSWERFQCNRDCANDQANCIGEWLLRNMTDLLVSGGFKDAGYEYVIIDDCWLADKRAEDGQLQPNPAQFPSGMKALADYIHSKGMKFGIYEDFGTKTCAGFPGSEYYMQMDAQTFADWGVDYLKLDVCNGPKYRPEDGFPPVAFYLEKTGRPILLSCEFVAYIHPADYTPVSKACNTARSYRDITDSWDVVADIISFFGKGSANFSRTPGPGFWNDPEELVVGDFGLSPDQERVQMGMWALLASPLLMSVDLRTIRPSSKALLLNPYVIALNQDRLGRQGTRLSTNKNIEVWRKPLADGSVAFALLHLGADGMPVPVSVKLSDLGLQSPDGFRVTDIFTGKVVAKVKADGNFTTPVNPTGIFLGKAEKM